MDIIDGYYQDKNFIESDEPLPKLTIGDMVSFKHGRGVHRVTGIVHYFYECEDGKVRHWMSVSVNGSKRRIQGNWTTKVIGGVR